MSLEISIIIPAKNEEINVKLLYPQLKKVLEKTNKTYEIIFVDDGSTDSTFIELSKIHERDKRVKIIRLRGNFGKSIALQSGFENAKGKIIFTMDADLQDNPKEIPNFLKKIDEGYDLVSGWKKKRYDPIINVIFSRIFNFLISILTGVKIHDSNCGFKAYKKEVTNNLYLYGELYRFIPIFAAKQNFKFTEIEVQHQERKYGKSKFGWEKNIKGFLDLLTVTFLTGYLRRPAHFFGMWGLASSFIGFIIGIYITYLRLTTGTIQNHQPLLILGILLIIVGVQLISTGLIAEMVLNINQKGSSTINYIQELKD